MLPSPSSMDMKSPASDQYLAPPRRFVYHCQAESGATDGVEIITEREWGG